MWLIRTPMSLFGQEVEGTVDVEPGDTQLLEAAEALPKQQHCPQGPLLLLPHQGGRVHPTGHSC